MLFGKGRKQKLESLHRAVTAKARRRKATLCSAIPEFMTVEPRRLFSTISVTQFGALPNTGVDAKSEVQAALNSAQSGDTVSFPAGYFIVGGKLSVPTGVTITGAGYTSTHLTFSLDAGEYGFNLDANDSNVTIEGLDIRSNNGAVLMNQGDVYNNVTIIGNSIEVGGSANSTYWAGIYSSVSMNNGTIDYNYFHNGPSGVRQFSLWQPTNTQVDYNLYYDVWDAGHVDIADSQSDIFSYQYNYGTGIINKGLEAQSQFGPTEQGNIDASYNVFYDWNNANYNTFGLSVPINYGTNSIVSHNYLAATVAPGSSYAPAENGQGQRFGYAIEAAGINGLVEDNTIIGPWVAGIVSSSAGTQADNNAFYGSDAWGDLTDESGIQPGVSISGGTGSLANTYDTNVADAPAPPPNTFAGPAFWNGTIPADPVSSSSSGAGSSGSGSGSSGGTSSGTPILPSSGDGGLNGVGSTGSSGSSSSSGGSSSGGGIASGTPILPSSGDGGLNSGGGFLAGSSGSSSGSSGGGASSGGETGGTIGTPAIANPLDLPVTDGKQMAPFPTDGPFTYISDMPFTTVDNGWGPVERDESNGETAPGDGQHLMTIDGTTFSKGIGMHAPGEIVVPLDGQYSTFKASIGMDDEELPLIGRSDIEIWGDGKELAETGVVHTGEEAVNLTVNVTGVQYLSIVARQEGTKNWAHVDLGYARVYPISNTNVSTDDDESPDADPTTVANSTPTYLSDLPMTQINGSGAAQRDLSDSGDDTPITIDGQVYDKGLGVSGSSDLQFNLNGSYNTFFSDIGLDDDTSGTGAVDFEVFTDGQMIYNSGTITGGQAAQAIRLDVAGAKTLDLVVVPAVQGSNADVADWADAQVST